MTFIDVHVGCVLRDKRRAAQLELREAATAARVGEDELIRIEGGMQRATAENVMTFCRLYGMSPAQLYRGILIPAEGALINAAAQ